MPVAAIRGLEFTVMSDKTLPDQEPIKSACRNDVILKCNSPFVVADKYGYTDKAGHHPALCCPLTNLQRYMTAHGL